MEYSVEKYLLDVSRKSIMAVLNGRDLEDIALRSEPPEEALKERASFVTLKKNGELRGCIGSLEAYRPLYKDVIYNSVNSAFKDPRFDPVTVTEMDSITIEISALSERKEVHYNDYEELKKKIEPGRHGVFLTYSIHSSTFLPQVWEQLPEPDDFFNHLCMKAGLPPEFLKKNKVKIETYTVEKFEEGKSR
ncbi:MAG: AmmeMemoRadiSam system protein A [Candidatus Delongbacteria bacterium]